MTHPVVYATEKARELEPELRELLPAHMAEFEVYGAPLEPAPDYDTYRALADRGVLVAMTARAGGRLIGYWLGHRFPDPHHTIKGQRVVVMMSQAHHIVPEWRARVALGFFRYIERVAREMGADMLAQRVRPGERTEGFFKTLEYQLAETVHVKRLYNA